MDRTFRLLTMVALGLFVNADVGSAVDATVKFWGSLFTVTDLPPFSPDHPYNQPDLPIKDRVEDLLSRMVLKEKLALLSGSSSMTTRRNQRLRIPIMKMTDGPHGVGGSSKSTCFPTGVSLAATWNPPLIRDVGIALARETRARGKHVLLGPCVNIHRTPLGGRNFESFGEDPYLTSRITVAYVQGVQSQRIGTSTKHFAANNQEWKRKKISVEIDERALREIYLPAFKAAVQEANTMMIMAAYNRLNGDYACANEHLLIDILKEEWGFSGLVVSDWGAVHSTAKTANAGTDLEMPGPGKFFSEQKLSAAVKNGEVSIETIDDKARRILGVMFRLGLFDEPDQRFSGALDTPEHRRLARLVAVDAIVLLKNKGNLLPLDADKTKSIAVIGPNAAVARLGGGGSSTVRPIYSVSPLDGLKSRAGDDIAVTYSEGVSRAEKLTNTPLDLFSPPGANGNRHGLKGEYYDNKNFQGQPALTRVDGKINFEWGRGSPSPEIPRDDFSIRWTGTFTPVISDDYVCWISSDDGSRLYVDDKLLVDNWGDHAEVSQKNSIYLTAGQSYQVRIEYYESGGRAVMRFGCEQPGGVLKHAVETAEGADVAVVFVGLSYRNEGEGLDKKTLKLPEGQNELIREVVKANPNTIVVLINGSPVLMDEWIDRVPAVVEAWYPGQEGGNAIADILFGDVNPSGKTPTTFPRKYDDVASSKNYPGQRGKVHYEEGIFVGYRHFDKNNIEPLFPFGHGLSYTDFQYSNLQITSKDNITSYPIEVRVDIQNIGDRSGREVVQLYLHDEMSGLPRPKKELKRFQKVDLKPGEKRTLRFDLDESSLAYYDPSIGEWVVEPGDFEVLVGSSSRDIRVTKNFRLRRPLPLSLSRPD